MKKILSLILAGVLACSLAGCGSAEKDRNAAEKNSAQTEVSADTADSEAETDAVSETDTGSITEDTSGSITETADSEPYTTVQPIDMNVAVLKGPTAIGMVNLMHLNESGNASNNYTFTIAGTADEITPKLISGEIPIAAIPCNLAAVLYQKSNGNVVVLSTVNLGVLYFVETGSSVQSMDDLKGKTIYLTGAGTTPEYTVRYLLSAAGIDPDKDVTLEFLSEATEVAAKLSEADTDTVAVLPEPYVTSVLSKNDRVKVVLDLNEIWSEYSDTPIITGVIAANKEYLNAHEENVKLFLSEYKENADYVAKDIEGTAVLLEKYDIFKAAVMREAIPRCNLATYTGSEMKASVSAYLQTLYDQNPKAVGGAMPGDDFYYGAE